MENQSNAFKDLATKIVTESLHVKSGDKVLIDVLGRAEDMVEALVDEIYARGAQPFLRCMTIEQLKRLIRNCTKEQLDTWVKHELYRMKNMQAAVNIRADDNIFELNDIPKDQYMMYLKHYAYPIHAAFAKLEDYVILKYPTYGLAQLAKMSLDEFKSLYFRSCLMDYTPLSEAAAELSDLLGRTDRVRVTSPGTDLTFSIKGMSNFLCDGRYNLPDGEMFTAPILDSVRGYITFNIPTLNLGLTFEQIYFRIHQGKIVEHNCNDPKTLGEILSGDEGASRIGEFGIGFNPYITKPTYNLLFDEKMAGSVHFAIGHSLDMADNGNRSAVHWDMVLCQLKEFGGGELFFDDVLVRKDGYFLSSKLSTLNPG